jgi:hypothetical protein
MHVAISLGHGRWCAGIIRDSGLCRSGTSHEIRQIGRTLWCCCPLGLRGKWCVGTVAVWKCADSLIQSLNYPTALENRTTSHNWQTDAGSPSYPVSWKLATPQSWEAGTCPAEAYGFRSKVEDLFGILKRQRLSGNGDGHV